MSAIALDGMFSVAQSRVRKKITNGTPITRISLNDAIQIQKSSAISCERSAETETSSVPQT